MRTNNSTRARLTFHTVANFFVDTDLDLAPLFVLECTKVFCGILKLILCEVSFDHVESQTKYDFFSDFFLQTCKHDLNTLTEACN